jgi:SAM-dependent methyltransferase
LSILKSLGDNSSATSLATKMRKQRFGFFLSLLGTVPRPLRILDLGGTQEFWDMMAPDALSGVHVTLLNLHAQPVSATNFESVAGDARDLSRYVNLSFDVVFSNSVIEHLGPDFNDQKQMADEVMRVGERYFVQTPNRYFPLEPHFLTPAFQFFPVDVRVWLVSNFNVGWYKRIPDRSKARRAVESISLLSRGDVKRLFPGAQIYTEKIAGMTKSFVAYGGWN